MLYFVEAGLLLVVVPWTVFWERNFFIEGTWLGRVLTIHAVRGAISAIGVLCVLAGVAELWAWRVARRLTADRPGDPVLPFRDESDRRSG